MYILHAIRNTTSKDIDRLFKKGAVLICFEHSVREKNYFFMSPGDWIKLLVLKLYQHWSVIDANSLGGMQIFFMDGSMEVSGAAAERMVA